MYNVNMSETQLEPMSDSVKAEVLKKLINKIRSLDENDTPKTETTTPTPSSTPSDK
jgi:hypothetical protein